MREFGYFRVATASPKVRVASTHHNAQRIVSLMYRAQREGVELVLFPELSITGYTCGDLFGQSTLLTGAQDALQSILEQTQDVDVVAVVGMPIPYMGRLYNCAVVICKGKIFGAVPKRYIPNYSEFYESRWFSSGDGLEGVFIELCGECVELSTKLIFDINGVMCGVEICEDLWVATPPSSKFCDVAEVVMNLSASPAVVGKYQYTQSLIEQQSARCLAGYIYSSAGFGESSTDLTFSAVGIIAENGVTLSQARRYSIEEELTVADLDIEKLRHERRRMTTFGDCGSGEYSYKSIGFSSGEQNGLMRMVDSHPFVPKVKSERDERCEEILSIQALGLAQRFDATGCKVAVVGISGGLDSTLALLVTVRAFDILGLDRAGIVAITMPGFGTTKRTFTNAHNLISELGVTMREISIRDACNQHFSDIGLPEDDRSVAYENSQARERTQILMDVANMEGGMVIGTGDLSELALGWATYNGDHMSMYGVNSSIPKTLVRYLIEWFAEQSGEGLLCQTLLDIIATPVSPELLPSDENGEIAQKTEDFVGPYELHDFFLYNFVREGFSPAKSLYLAQHAFAGVYDVATIRSWLKVFIKRFFSQQFKRSAMPDGVKVGSVTLSPRGDWRMPSDAASDLWLTEF
ncbi:MAG: NAD(+) synthase [Rikenellaceae bacterium]